MTGEKPRMFGINLMKIEDDIIDLGDGRKITLDTFKPIPDSNVISIYNTTNT